MMQLPAGDSVIDFIDVAYQSDQPVMLVGKHGIGKSSLFEEAARRLGIEIIVCDLSLMEPVDLVGIPRVNSNGRTEYCAPSFLPTGGKGLLVFEELNRCPRNVRVPCLQLLTARMVNDYKLPPGWLPCAIINDGPEYDVDDLDPALRSRFVQLLVEPNVDTWIEWAKQFGNVHQKIIEFVALSLGIFDNPEPDPRSWTYAGNLLRTWEDSQYELDLLTVLLAGVIGETWATVFLEFYGSIEGKPLRPEDIIHDYPLHRAKLIRRIDDARLDIADASLKSLLNFLQQQKEYEVVIENVLLKENVETFFSDLPPDLKKIVRSRLKDRDFCDLKVPSKAKPCQPISSEKRRGN